MTPIAPAIDAGTQPAFEHGEAGLGLPALAVVAVMLVEALLHLPAIAARGQFLRRPPGRGGDVRTHAAPLARVAVVAFRVVAGVGQHGADADGRQRGVEQRHQAVAVGARAAAGQGGQQQVAAAVEGGFELGEAAVRHGLPVFLGAAAAHVVAAGVAAVQARRIQGDARQAAPPAQEMTDGAVEEAAGHGRAQQAAAGLLRRGEVGHAGQAEDGAQVAMVAQLDGQAAIVGLEEGLQDQASEQLGLGELLGAAAMRITGQGRRGEGHGLPGDAQR